MERSEGEEEQVQKSDSCFGGSVQRHRIWVWGEVAVVWVHGWGTQVTEGKLWLKNLGNVSEVWLVESSVGKRVEDVGSETKKEGFAGQTSADQLQLGWKRQGNYWAEYLKDFWWAKFKDRISPTGDNGCAKSPSANGRLVQWENEGEPYTIRGIEIQAETT